MDGLPTARGLVEEWFEEHEDLAATHIGTVREAQGLAKMAYSIKASLGLTGYVEDDNYHHLLEALHALSILAEPRHLTEDRMERLGLVFRDGHIARLRVLAERHKNDVPLSGLQEGARREELDRRFSGYHRDVLHHLRELYAQRVPELKGKYRAEGVSESYVDRRMEPAYAAGRLICSRPCRRLCGE